ncbi:MAG: hypothetical protein F2849_04660 [Actinobacteria bacterium]|nr:hypothetical protein [Actinomycetota bacterium]
MEESALASSSVNQNGSSEGRWVDLEGPANFRDLGGLPIAAGGAVRMGVLFRSDSLKMLTDGDLEFLVTTVGLRRVVDLRSGPEIERHGQSDLEACGVEIIHQPIVDETRGPKSKDNPEGQRPEVALREAPLSLDLIYLYMLETFPQRFAAAVEALSDPERQPVVFHCAAGKDRTGLIGALVLELCGVERDLIIHDFLLTNDRMELMIERHRESAEASGREAEIEAQTLFPTEEILINLFREFDVRHGGAEAYLLAAGIDPKVIASLRSALVEPRPA